MVFVFRNYSQEDVHDQRQESVYVGDAVEGALTKEGVEKLVKMCKDCSYPEKLMAVDNWETVIN